MRPLRGSWLGFHRLVPSLVLLLLAVSAGSADPSPCRRESSPAPDGVCYPVNGTGYMVTCGDNVRMPIGTLSPLIAGDSLVVESGTITFVDFRTGMSPIYGAGTRLAIPPSIPPKPPCWWNRLEEYFIRGIKEPQRNRIGGSVRDGGSLAFWPDGGRFAPEVPVVLEWSGVNREPVFLRICTDRDTTECAVSRTAWPQGALAWHLPTPVPTGTVAWALFDAARDRLGGGRFVVLTSEAAEAERRRFRDAAARVVDAQQSDMAAAVLAAADHAYLW